jgi:hypothetical protein
MNVKFINKYPILIKPELYQLIGTDSDVFWLINKLMNRADVMQKNCFPSLETLAQETGFSTRKLQDVIKRAIDLKLLRKSMRVDDNNRQTSNLYTITTNLIGFLIFTTADAIYNDFEGSKKQQGGGVQNLPTNYNKTQGTLSTTSDYENFELDETRKMILSSKGFDLALYELELLNWRDYIKTLGKPPTNLTSSFTSWCLNVVAQHTKTNKALDKTKSKEEVYKEGLETGDWSDIWQGDNETVEEFEERVKARQEMTGSRYKKHYTNSASNLVKI